MSVMTAILKKYRIAAVSAIVMLLIELAVELVQPLIISRIIDHGIRQHAVSVAWIWGGVLMVSALAAFLAGIASSFFASHVSQGFGYDLRDKLYEKVQSFSYEVFNRFAASSLITRLTGDITVLQDVIFMCLRFASRVPLVVVGSVVMALVVHVKLGLLLTVTVPVLLAFVLWMIRKASALFRTVQRRTDHVNGLIQENLTGMRLIRVFVRMSHEIGRFEQRNRALREGTVAALKLTETTMPFLLFIMNAGIIAVLWFGRIEIADGGASVGEVVAVINYSLRTIGALSALSWIMSSLSRGAASAGRVREVLEENDPVGERESRAGGASGADVVEDAAPIQGRIEFREVSFRYPGRDVMALERISFTAEPGQRIAILGATGSGKSSLVQLIPGMYEPTEGTILIDGTDIRELDRKRLRRAIGYVPQEVMLFSGTIRENIAWGREDATLEQIRTAARQAQIHDTIERQPQGYETRLGQRGVNLSGGQKQRLSIARALIRRPAILILDDSTSALDVRTEAALLKEISRLSCTTLLVTQKISSTMTADLILLLDDGRLIASGKHEELLQHSELYRRICESQLGKEAEAHVVQDLH
ncbi:ABC transporter ATP-binding protein [Paenibacillus barengoltzii]|jgi:ATP-binding cassette subfamily B protein|uniref:ABC transporter ATP-binding protein n=1 Tax=Paenibacillus barengoltzii TaxID=343517 RepID=UPI000A08D7BC|nr:ABC transporter ATP-binding protein [Paenibacillus barengoltzii]MEC2346778.1 ABC transporter ATP-binding protein [Paenibacillus barengoltzii]SMF52910.1 ATP-binding cassette, subfamily B [Paenibacillus barengoltzii]